MARALSPKVRFSVFERDGFTCQYCGGKPPESLLEVDHIHPVSKGGDNSFVNLLTSCFECNRGKSARVLSMPDASIEDRTARIKEAEMQVLAYREMLQKQRDRQDEDVWQIVGIIFDEQSTTTARYNSILNFLRRMDYFDVVEAATIARLKPRMNKENRFKYFCGVCWRKIGASNEH